MAKCTHCETCEDCFEANRKLKVEAAIKNELRREISERLGVSHLKGEEQLRAAVRQLDWLTAQRPALSPIGSADAVEG